MTLLNQACAALALGLSLAGAVAGCGDVTGDVIVRAPGTGGCDSDAACTAAEAPRCELDSGSCVRCLEAQDCPTGQVCALPANSCVPSCVGGDACGAAEPVCDAESGVCRGCTSDPECPAATPRCLPTGACVACVVNDDCRSDSEEPFCDALGRCVECLNDGHCDELDESCSTVLGECAEPCSPTLACGSDDPICDADIGFCVECQRDADCDDGELCRGSECVDPGDDDEGDNQEEGDDD